MAKTTKKTTTKKTEKNSVKKVSKKPSKRVCKKSKTEIDGENDALINEHITEIDEVTSILESALTALQSIGLPQEMIDETENRILEARDESERLRMGIF